MFQLSRLPDGVQMTIGYLPLHGQKVENDMRLFDDLNMEVGSEYVFNKFTVKYPLGKLQSNLNQVKYKSDQN